MLIKPLMRVALLLCIAPLPALGQGSDSVVSVNMFRTASVPAQRVVAYVSVEGTAETAREAINRATAAMAPILTALRSVGRVELGAPRIVSVGENPALRGYPAGQLPLSRVARSVLRIQALRPDVLMEAIAAALDAGAKNVSTLTFESMTADSTRRELLKEATTAARLEAEVLARELGGRLGALLGAGTTSPGPFQQPVTITFDGSYSAPMQPRCK